MRTERSDAEMREDEILIRQIKCLEVAVGGRVALCKQISISPATLYRNKLEPWRFELGELRRLKAVADQYGMPLEVRI